MVDGRNAGRLRRTDGSGGLALGREARRGSRLRVLHPFFIPDLKAFLVKPHLPPVFGIDADSHELIPRDSESAPVASVAGPRPERIQLC
jgi:hypothetical protein